MPDEFQDVDFAGHTLHIGHVDYTALLQNFDGHFLARERVRPQLDFPESTLADCLP